jgi:hypothetical protein
VCQSPRARGSNVTYAAPTRAGGLDWNKGSRRTMKVNWETRGACDTAGLRVGEQDARTKS